MPVIEPPSVVHGVLYLVRAEERSLLDQAEGMGRGYDAISDNVWLEGQEQLAMTYQATKFAPGWKPYDWYKALVLAGALEHQLPVGHIRGIAAVPSAPDPDPVRASQHWQLLRASPSDLRSRSRTLLQHDSEHLSQRALRAKCLIVSGNVPNDTYNGERVLDSLPRG